MKVGKDRKSSVLPADETSMFCTQIALVLKSGISLADGTEAIYSSCENGPGKKYFEEISTAVTQTGSLYEAVKQVGIFPSYMVPMFITTLSQTRMKSRFLAADEYISPKKSNSVGASWLKPSRKIAHLRLSSPPYIMEAQRRQAR